MDAGATPTWPGPSKRSLAPSSSTRATTPSACSSLPISPARWPHREAADSPRALSPGSRRPCRRKAFAPPIYEIVHASGKDHAREFTAAVLVDGKAVGRGTGTRKSHAEQAAAAEALTAMGLG